MRSPRSVAATGRSATSVERATGYQYGFNASYMRPSPNADLSSEDDHAATNTVLQRGERVIDPFQRIAARHQPVERKLPGGVEIDVARDVDARAHVPLHHAVKMLVADEAVRREREARARRRRTHDVPVTARPHHLDELRQGNGIANALEGVIRAASGDLAHPLHGVLGRAVHRVRRAEGTCIRELVVVDVD